MDDGRFEVLAAEREKRGLTQKDISEMTRIPIQHLECLERAAFDGIPEGPYIDAYYRDYCRALGLKPMAPPIGVQVSTGADGKGALLPLWVVRFVAVASVASMLGWFAYQTWRTGDSVTAPSAEVASDSTPTAGDQILKVHVRKTGRFLVTVDNAVVLDERVEEGTRMTFVADSAIEMQLPGVGFVHLEYNGRTIVPQGLQNQPRTLRFLDDLQRENHE